MSESTKAQAQPKNQKLENPLLSIGFNIILPVLVLEKLSKYLPVSPVQTLILALSLPIIYGIVDYAKNKRQNMMSIFGIVNTLLTGGLALYELKGIWFAIKEASFPLLIGIAVFISAYTKKPAISLLAYNENLFNVGLIKQRLEENNRSDELFHILKKCTLLFGYSFIISAVLNFVLAKIIFIPIDHISDIATRKNLLNSQISEMTWKGFIVIALPMMGFLAFVFWKLFSSLKKATGLSNNELLSSRFDK